MSNSSAIREDASITKAVMDAIYVQPDPRAYFRALGPLDYAIPGAANPIFARMAMHLASTRAHEVCALDVGCSYGVNAALLNHDLDIDDLTAHWADPALDGVDADSLADADRAFFAERRDADIRMIGIDPSAPAVAYADRIGLLDRGFALDLERAPLPEDVAGELAPVDMVISTGCVGYVTERTFDALLPAVSEGEAPWFGNFVLRMFPYDAIATALADHGYVTEKLAGHSFVQRDFVSEHEQARVVAAVEALGVDPAGHEAEGALHAEFFLSRPLAEAATPVAHLLEGAIVH